MISITKNSLLNKFIISFLQCLQVWYCTYKIIFIISKINTVFPVPLYRESLLLLKHRMGRNGTERNENGTLPNRALKEQGTKTEHCRTEHKRNRKQKQNNAEHTYGTEMIITECNILLRNVAPEQGTVTLQMDICTIVSTFYFNLLLRK